ncbi:MAG: hypothetical protein MHM6MM_002750 [Cercozoa sp. M6MM]
MPERFHCFLDLATREGLQGRLVVELFADVVPKTCNNFKQLCTGTGTRKSLCYVGSRVSRVVPGFAFHAGALSGYNLSSRGGTFRDENFDLPHDGAGVLSMVSPGRDKCGSQFSVSFRSTPQLNNVQVVFGKVVAGFDLMNRIEQTPVAASGGGRGGRPVDDLVIARCGLVPADADIDEFAANVPEMSVKEIDEAFEADFAQELAQISTRRERHLVPKGRRQSRLRVSYGDDSDYDDPDDVDQRFRDERRRWRGERNLRRARGEGFGHSARARRQGNDFKLGRGRSRDRSDEKWERGTKIGTVPRRPQRSASPEKWQRGSKLRPAKLEFSLSSSSKPSLVRGRGRKEAYRRPEAPRRGPKEVVARGGVTRQCKGRGFTRSFASARAYDDEAGAIVSRPNENSEEPSVESHTDSRIELHDDYDFEDDDDEEMDYY